MKKFVILVVVAAVVGIVISRLGGSSSSQTNVSERQEMQGASPTSGASQPLPGVRRLAPPAPPERMAGLTGPRAEAVVASAAPLHQPGFTQVRPPLSATASARPPEPAPARPQLTTGTQPAPAEPAAAKDVKQPASPASAMQQVEALLAAGKRVPARKLLSDLYWRGDAKTRESAQAILERMNREMVFNPRNTEGAKVHTVQQGEVLATIAKKYGVNWRMIARLNNIEPDSGFIRVGQPLKILPGQQRILVDQSDFTLALFIDGQFIKQYRVGLGKDGKTPMGEFVIEQMLIQPDWYPPEGGVIKYGEKGHVIGERWVGFKNQPGATGIGIHGTSEPQTIGTYCSNGCVRMNNADVIELYDFVSPGTRVTIVP